MRDAPGRPGVRECPVTAAERQAWLRSLDPGDEVAIVSPDICVQIERVARVRADDRVVTGNTRVYRVSDGRRIGVEIDERIEPVTQEHREAVERQELGRWLRALPDQDPTLEQLRAMRRALEVES